MTIAAHAAAYAWLTGVLVAVLGIWFPGPDPLAVGLLVGTGYLCRAVEVG